MLIIKIPCFYDDLYAMEGFILPQLCNGKQESFESTVLASVTDVYRWCPETLKNSNSRPSTCSNAKTRDEPAFVHPLSGDAGKPVETLEKIVDSHTIFTQHNPEDVAAMEAIILDERKRERVRKEARTSGTSWQVVHRPKEVLSFDDTDPEEEAATSTFEPISTTESESENETENESDVEGRSRQRAEPLRWDSISAVEDMERTLVFRPSRRRLQSATDPVGDESDAADDEWTLLT